MAQKTSIYPMQLTTSILMPSKMVLKNLYPAVYKMQNKFSANFQLDTGFWCQLKTHQ